MSKYKRTYLFFVIILINFSACSDLSNALNTGNNTNTGNHQAFIDDQETIHEITTLIERFLESQNNNDIDGMANILYFTENDINSGWKDGYLNAVIHLSSKNFNLDSIIKINENIFLTKGSIDSNAGGSFRTVEFNPFICIIDGEPRIVLLRRQIPPDLYDSIYIPDNYSFDDPRYITEEFQVLPLP